jgi:small ligand-binding sensory domain FIST
LVQDLSEGLGSPDLVVLFCTPHHAPSRSGLVAEVQGAFPGAVVFGSVGAGVLGAGLEHEGTSAIAGLAARLPGVTLHPFHLDQALLGPPEDAAMAVADALGEDTRGLMILSDPYTLDLGAMLPAITAAAPGVPVFGAQASGVRSPGPHELFLRSRVHGGGVVAHGCRPVGPPMFVTSCQGNRILELDGKPPTDVLRKVYEDLTPSDQLRFQRGQLLGVQMRDQDAYERGDFLVRHLLGVPPDGRGVALGGSVERYAVVQLQVRDAASAHEDLVRRLQGVPPAAGALLFTCLGRGRGLYGEPHHDSRTFLEEVGPTPMAGLFANGEIGPVHGELFVHGYTSVFALFGGAQG